MPDQPDYHNTLFNILSMLGFDLPRYGQDALNIGAAGNIPDPRAVRHAQVKQYQHPEENVLPPAKYRPTDLTKFLDQPFRSQADYMPEHIGIDSNVHMPTVDELRTGGPVRIPSKGVYGWGGPNAASRVPNFLTGERGLQGILGLGNANTSLGYDPQRQRPYLSVFDSWDFDPNGGGETYVGFPILQTLGKPFNVYDRVYITPEDHGTIPRYFRADGDGGRIGDIDLPNHTRQDPRLKYYTHTWNGPR